MAQLTTDSTQVGNLDNTLNTWDVTPASTDSGQGAGEHEWGNRDWTTYYGYFNSIPDLKSALILKSTWIVGRGYETDSRTKVILDHIKGWGKDSFKNILFSMYLTALINGDSYAEIIKQKNTIINLKPLDPQTIKIIVERGVIKRYEQHSKVDGKIIKFKPDEVFHLCYNRVADEIHGTSAIKAIDQIIKANQENFEDLKKIMHRQAKPLIVFKMKTDDEATIARFIAKIESAMNKGDHVYIPDDENILSFEVIQASPNQIVMQWRDELRNSFYRTIGLPQILSAGGGQSTESESKVIYTGFEQIVQHEQIDIETQVWNQLGLKIDLIHPSSLIKELQQDQQKDANQGLGFQQGEIQAGVGK